MIEEYKKLKDYPAYRIYNTGKIYSEYTKKFLRRHHDSSGYLHVTLFKGSKKTRKTFKVHILVAKAFIPNPLNKPEVNHIDCNKENNKVTNLEWVTKHENMIHASKFSYKNRESLSPLTKEMVEIIPLLLTLGMSIKLIATLYRVGHITIRNIIQGKTWKQLNLVFTRNNYKKGIIEVPRNIYNKLKSFNVDNTVLNSRVKVLESV